MVLVVVECPAVVVVATVVEVVVVVVVVIVVMVVVVVVVRHGGECQLQAPMPLILPQTAKPPSTSPMTNSDQRRPATEPRATGPS